MSKDHPYFEKQIVITFKIDKASPNLAIWSWEKLGDLSDGLYRMFTAMFGEGYVYHEVGEEDGET